jgi:hypothetical protein
MFSFLPFQPCPVQLAVFHVVGALLGLFLGLSLRRLPSR